MSRDVFLTAKAERQLHAAADWYAQRSQAAADNWFNGILAEIIRLGDNAERFELARENDAMPFELREMRFGVGRRITHRILFAIRPDRIVVHQIRHVAQRDITETDE